MEVERLQQAPQLVQVLAHTRTAPIPCPACGQTGSRVHSRYRRRLADAAVGGRRLVIVLTVRRWFCDDPACQRRTFTEQIPGLTSRYQRRTPWLRAMLEAIAVALAGRAGVRLAHTLKAATSRSSLLRLLMALPDPPAATPRVLGVDDFALRRGQVYASVLTDCATGAPIDLLPGREAKPLASWLQAHPGVEVVCRDRWGAYADGARLGAPDAVQVADRFHLWQNLGKATERCVAAHRACLRLPEPEPTLQPPSSEEAEPAGRFAQRARRHHALVHDLLTQGHSLRGIARHLDWGFRTVHRYARAATWQELVEGKWQQPRPSKLDAFKPYLHQRWEQGCHNALGLHREITALGYAGSYALVRDYLRSCLRSPRPQPGLLAPAPPTVRAVTGWLTRHPETLTAEEQVQLKAILENCPELRATAEHLRAFGEMLTQLGGQDLPGWIAAVQADNLPGLASFAAHLERDLAAVTCGLTMRWNSGPVEGRVNHIKMLKRQMFGRASLPVLRKRVLLTASRRGPAACP